MTTKEEIAKRGTIWIPNDNRKCFIKRLKTDGSYDDWYEVTKYVSSWGTISQGFGDDVYVGEFSDEDTNVSFDNSSRLFNDVNDNASIFKGYKTRYKTLFKIELYAVGDDDMDVLLKAWYGVNLDRPVLSGGDMEFTLSSTLKILQLYKADGIDLTPTTTDGLVNRLVNKTQSGVSLFDRYFTGYKINPDALSTMTISKPNIKDDATVLDKIKAYSSYQNFFYYVDNEGYFVWDSKEETATTQWEFNGAGNTDSTYGTNIQDIDSYYDDVTNTYTRVVINYKENEILDKQLFSGVRKDDGSATLTDANSVTIYDQMVTDLYIGTDSRLTQKYITDRGTLDAYLLASWSGYEGNIINKLDDTINASDASSTYQTAWTPGDGSVGDVYGDKIFTEDYDELTYTEANSVAQRIYDAYKNTKSVLEMKVTGAYHLQPKDKCLVNYMGEINVTNPFVIGVSKLGGGDVLAGRTGSIRINGMSVKIEHISINLDNFDIIIKEREI